MNQMKINLRVKQQKYKMIKYSTDHTLQRKRQKIVDYRDKIFDDFRLMIVDPSQNLESEESDILYTSFGTPRVNQSNEVMSKMVLTYI